MGKRVVVDEPTIRDILRRLEALENARGATAEVQEMSVSRSSSPTPEPSAAGLAHLYSEATAVARSILPSSELLQTLEQLGAADGHADASCSGAMASKYAHWQSVRYPGFARH